MPSKLAELLIKEHSVILEAMETAFGLNRRWDKDPEGYASSVTELMNFFAEYADKYHHHKEEEILFPAMSKKNEVVAGGIVYELLDQHDHFRDLGKEVRAALAVKDYAEAQKKIEEYMRNLRDHIAAENDELFPMADLLFNGDELELMYHRCQDRDASLGDERKQKLADLIKSHKLLSL